MIQGRISPFGEEFGLMEHQLRLQLSAPTLKVREIFNIRINSLTNQFNSFIKHMPNPNLVDVFIPLNDLGQSKSEITSHGVKVSPKHGLKFRTNSLELDPSKEYYDIVHITVALGRVFNYQSPIQALEGNTFGNYQKVTHENIPNGYNSLRISNENDFVIFQSNQVNTVHLIRLKGGNNLSKDQPCANTCSDCHKHNAVYWCKQDGMKLCANCDDKIHKVSEVMQKHERIPLEDALVVNQECTEHPDKLVEYYCPKCHIPICMECTVDGSHSHREAKKHKLIRITEAYELTKNKLKRANPIRVNREKALKSAIHEAENAIADVTSNLNNVIVEIKRICDRAIEDARTKAGQKILVAKSALAELNRKYDEFKAQKEIVRTYFVNGEPVSFLETYRRNELLDREIESNLDLQRVSGVLGDLAVCGKLGVSVQKAKNEAKKDEVENNKSNNDIDGEQHEDAKGSADRIKPCCSTAKAKFTTLTKVAERKLKKYEEMGSEINFKPFEGSAIISNEDIALKLYLCFPFKATPETHLLFATYRDGRNVTKMHKMVDGIGISVIILKVGKRVFGGFAASKWNSDGVPFGEGTSSFIFSINHDAFIAPNPQVVNPIYLLGTPGTFSFGGDDLVISDDFDRCASNLGNTFDVGLQHGSEDAQTFLAGKPKFAADEVEVWSFFSPKE